MTQRIEMRSIAFPQSLLGRVVGAVLAAALLVAAFFFLFFVLIVVGVAIVALLLRAWWRARQVRAKASQDIIEGEYSVEVSDVKRIDDQAIDPAQER